MTKAKLIIAIHNVISKNFPSIALSEFSENSRLYEDLYFDSILLMQLLVQIELVLGVEIPDTALNKNDFHTVSNLADFVLRCNLHTSSKSPPQKKVVEHTLNDNDSKNTKPEEFEDIKVHCFVSCICEAVKADTRVDHRPFYFGVWDAEVVIDNQGCLNYHNEYINHDFFIHWYKKLYGVDINSWYRQDLDKKNNIDNLHYLLEHKSKTQNIMVMLDMYRLPERENKFKRDPFPHYVMLENTDDPRRLYMFDPDFRWEGEQETDQVIHAIQSDAVAGGYIFDSQELRPTAQQAIYDYFLACFNDRENPLTNKVRELVKAQTSDIPPAQIQNLHICLSQLPILAIRKYAYEHGFAFFWRAHNLEEEEFEAWCDVIEDLVSTYKKIQYRSLKLSTHQYSKSQSDDLISEINSLLDQQDQREFRIKFRLKQVFDQWSLKTINNHDSNAGNITEIA